MRDTFQVLVDADATLEEAPDIAEAVVERFRKTGLITGSANCDCVPEGAGYRPGPAVAESYNLEERECQFWTLDTCGVEPIADPWFNASAFCDVCEGVTCPACGAEIEPKDDAFGDAMCEAMVDWSVDEPALVACPACGKEQSITVWQCKPPFGFGNVSFRFWNWPSFDSPSWTINIPKIFQEVTGHSIVKTHGRQARPY